MKNRLSVYQLTKYKYGVGCESSNLYTSVFHNLDAKAKQRMRDTLVSYAVCEASKTSVEVELRFNDEPLQHFVKCKGGQLLLQTLRVHRYEQTKDDGTKASERTVWNSTEPFTLTETRNKYIRSAKVDSLDNKLICLQFNHESLLKFCNGDVLIPRFGSWSRWQRKDRIETC